MKERIAYDFLLNYYFKVTTESDVLEVLTSAIRKAFNDATGQGAFNTIVSKESKENLEEVKAKALDTMYRILNRHCLQRDSFKNDWHKQWCNEIVDIFEAIKSKDGTTAFTYGNAQKWINMTLKNMYIMAIAFKSSEKTDKNDWCNDIINNANCFHVPIDNYVLEMAVTDFNTMNDLIKIHGKKNKLYRIISGGKEYCWSSIPTYCMYSDFQDALKKEISKKYNESPIDWECREWVKVAQNKKTGGKLNGIINKGI